LKSAVDDWIGNGTKKTLLLEDLPKIEEWDTSRITQMTELFYNQPFNADISKWVTSNVTTMENLFWNAALFNSDLSDWDVSKVKNFERCFSGAASFNGDISKWSVSNAISMASMFYSLDLSLNLYEMNSNLMNWDVSNVINMNGMFSGVIVVFDISKWDVSKVENMELMFGTHRSPDGSQGFLNPFTKIDVSKWNVSSVTTLKFTFAGLTNFTSDLSHWDVSKVSNFGYTFSYASSFNSDLSKWNVGSLVGMPGLFSGASSFNSDLSKWAVTKLGENFYVFSQGMEGNQYDFADPDSKFSAVSIAFKGADTFDGIICNDYWVVSLLATKLDTGLPTLAGGRYMCCKPGEYRVVLDGDHFCQECPMGSIARTRNAELMCEKCGRDTFSATTGLDRCANCTSDMFSGIGQTRCTVCSAGQLMIRNKWNTTCQACDAGHFQKDPGTGTFCSFMCLKNRYSIQLIFSTFFFKSHHRNMRRVSNWVVSTRQTDAILPSMYPRFFPTTQRWPYMSKLPTRKVSRFFRQ
jgi:surface protein